MPPRRYGSGFVCVAGGGLRDAICAQRCGLWRWPIVCSSEQLCCVRGRWSWCVARAMVLCPFASGHPRVFVPKSGRKSWLLRVDIARITHNLQDIWPVAGFGPLLAPCHLPSSGPRLQPAPFPPPSFPSSLSLRCSAQPFQLFTARVLVSQARLSPHIIQIGRAHV